MSTLSTLPDSSPARAKSSSQGHLKIAPGAIKPTKPKLSSPAALPALRDDTPRAKASMKGTIAPVTEGCTVKGNC